MPTREPYEKPTVTAIPKAEWTPEVAAVVEEVRGGGNGQPKPNPIEAQVKKRVLDERIRRQARRQVDLEEREAAGTASPSLDSAALTDAVKVAAQGRDIAQQGVPYVAEGLVPNLGVLGFLVACTKVGKTTLGHALGAAIANGAPFIGRETTRARVLYIAAEDPPEYTAWVARHLVVEPGQMTFYRRGVVLDEVGIGAICEAVRAGVTDQREVSFSDRFVDGHVIIRAEGASTARGIVADQSRHTPRDGSWLTLEACCGIARWLQNPFPDA